MKTQYNIIEEKAIRGPQSEIDKRNTEIKIFEKEIKELRNVYDAKVDRQPPRKDGHVSIPDGILLLADIKISWKNAFSECGYKPTSFGYKFNAEEKAYSYYRAVDANDIIERFNIKKFTEFDSILYIAENLSNFFLNKDPRSILSYEKMVVIGFNQNKFGDINTFVLKLENNTPKLIKLTMDFQFDRELIVLYDE